MEKLIELLNQYEKEIKKSEFYERKKSVGGEFDLFRRDTYDEEGSHIYSDTADTYVISKKYGFIIWLVENNKINREKVRNKAEFLHIYTLASMDKYYKSIIMELSIQDNPIEFLVDILK